MYPERNPSNTGIVSKEPSVISEPALIAIYQNASGELRNISYEIRGIFEKIEKLRRLPQGAPCEQNTPNGEPDDFVSAFMKFASELREERHQLERINKALSEII